MALLVHSGTAASDLAVAGTIRDDISDLLLSSLYVDNHVLALTRVGAEFAAQVCKWDEDALNQFKITDTAGQTTGSTAITVSASDAAVLINGMLLQEDLQVGTGEIVQITNISATTVTISRAYGGTTATTHLANAVWRVINAPTYQNSDLGKDTSRARVSKSNLVNRWEQNVNLDSEAILRAKYGYTPGVKNELSYQFQQRLLELKRWMQNGYWFSVQANSGAASTGGDFSTMWGVNYWLNGTANATAAPITTAEVLTDAVINNMAKLIHKQGALSQVLVSNVSGLEKVGQLYQDRIRMEQHERNRGFYARTFTPSMANKHYLVEDIYLNDVQGSIQLFMLDMDRIFIRPFVESTLYTISAPSFRDGDAIRMLSKWSLEIRNTGTDIGYAHLLHNNLSV